MSENTVNLRKFHERSKQPDLKHPAQRWRTPILPAFQLASVSGHQDQEASQGTLYTHTSVFGSFLSESCVTRKTAMGGTSSPGHHHHLFYEQSRAIH
jgi:hypothetical protein